MSRLMSAFADVSNSNHNVVSHLIAKLSRLWKYGNIYNYNLCRSKKGEIIPRPSHTLDMSLSSARS
jgi:hypothetical protein